MHVLCPLASKNMNVGVSYQSCVLMDFESQAHLMYHSNKQPPPFVYSLSITLSGCNCQ